MKIIVVILIIFISLTLVNAATLHGSIYNSDLELETDVLVDISTKPTQKYLSKDGTYTFELSPGQYQLSARKGFTEIGETIKIESEGNYRLDLFLIPDLFEEEQLWQDTQQEYLTEDVITESEKYDNWRYYLAGIIILYALFRFGKTRKKYGSLRAFKKKVKENRNMPQNDPGQIEEVFTVIKKHQRINQKILRKELLHLSEARVSLILTELEHKGKIEKIKKGRGNVIILK
jgi:uncharacterized membrane protein